MAFYRAAYRKARTQTRRPRAGNRTTGAYAASPAGKHRRLALNAFALAKKARAAGNLAHYRRMVAFGKRALALSRTEFRLWKKGLALRTRAFAAQRAVSARKPAAGLQMNRARYSYR